MNHLRSLAMALVLAALLAGCEDTGPLELEIEASAAEGMAPLTVNFFATPIGGAGGYSVSWDFGDGGTGRQANVSHVYEEAGHFNVVAQVVDDDDATAEQSISIVVTQNELPEVSLSASPSDGSAPLAVQFQADILLGEKPFTFLWQFGDGAQSEEEAPLHTFSQEGTYNVSLRITDATEEVVTETIQVRVDPAAADTETDGG